MGSLLCALFLSALFTLSSSDEAPGNPGWAAVDTLLLSAIARNTTPGVAAAVMDQHGTLVYTRFLGNFTYGSPAPLSPNRPVGPSTLFDMASISKLMGPVSTAAYLFQRGLYDIDLPLSDATLLGPNFSQAGKGGITSRHLLLHCAGFPPDPSPNYSSPAFACPGTAQPSPPLDFTCSEAIFSSILAQPLAAPPATTTVYSDLSMLTLLYALGSAIDKRGLIGPQAFLPQCAGAGPSTGLLFVCAYEAFWRGVIKPLVFGAAAPTTYLPSALAGLDAMPTYSDPVYRHRVMQGQVADANSYAAGGVAGHAGIFSTLLDTMAFAAAWMTPSPAAGGEEGGGFINATTAGQWLRVQNASFSSRALGWDTQSAGDAYMGCGGNFSARTAYHTGFTGQLVCIDVPANVSLALLTSRVYTQIDGNEDAIHALRQEFGDAVKRALASQ